ncbi:MAG: hypothetical protein NE330_04575 [Lentisphaeraceae bacterium]|nr:hypothetical protein [Lentisphaeraceae bacterium]
MKPIAFFISLSFFFFVSCQTLDYKVGELSEADSKEYHLDPSFYKKVTKVQDILIASSEVVSDHAHMETAYLFDKMMRGIQPEIAQRVRDKKVLCVLVGWNELTSNVPQFATKKTGKELDFYNWRSRGFLTKKNDRFLVFFAEEDVLEYEGGMRRESILIHEFGHVVHKCGFNEDQEKELTETFKRSMDAGLWRDGYAAQRFRRVKSSNPVSLLGALKKSFPDIPEKLLVKCLDSGDIIVNGKKTHSKVKVTKDDKVRIVFGGEKACYACKNKAEYFAEGFQIWFDTNRTMDHDHNHIESREQVLKYDPQFAAFLGKILLPSNWKFISPRERAGEGHLAGFNPQKSPKVVDPQHIKDAANDYYDKYWKDYWQRLAKKHSINL